MKDRIIYIVSFVFVFALITGLLIFLNSTYKNIFTFDFSPPNQIVTADSLQNNQGGPAEQKADTAVVKTVKPDSLKQTTVPQKADSNAVAVIDTSKAENTAKNSVSEKKSTDAALNSALKEKNIAKRDSVYKSWVKSTGKLYESMDSKKAAKIIQGYSDNIARDLLLIMKKKKAAEIIAEFKPDVATRIISAQQ